MIGRQRFSFDSYLSFQVIVHPLIVYPHLILKADKDEFIGIRKHPDGIDEVVPLFLAVVVSLTDYPSESLIGDVVYLPHLPAE